MRSDCNFHKDNGNSYSHAYAFIVENGCVLMINDTLNDTYRLCGGTVHSSECADDSVKRMIFEQIGTYYELEKLDIIYEHYWYSKNDDNTNKECQDLTYYYSMKPKGTQKIEKNTITRLTPDEKLVWLPIEMLDEYNVDPVFLKEHLTSHKEGLVHLIKDEK